MIPKCEFIVPESKKESPDKLSESQTDPKVNLIGPNEKSFSAMLRQLSKSMTCKRLKRTDWWRTYCQIDMETFRPNFEREMKQKCLTYHFCMTSTLLMTFLIAVASTYLAATLFIIWFLLMFQSLLHSLEMRTVYAECQPSTNRLLIDRPGEYGFTNYEIVVIKTNTPDVSITGYLLLQDQEYSTCPTLLFLHGNAGNMGHRLEMCKIMMKGAKMNIFIIDYRGYGQSNGFPTEAGLCEDAQVSLDYLLHRKDIDVGQIFVFGRSLGGALCIDLFTKEQNDGKILGFIIENTFTSLPAISCVIMSKVMGNLLTYVPNSFFYNIYPSAARVERYIRDKGENKVPGLFLIGDSDQLIPPNMTKSMGNAYFSLDNDIPQNGCSATNYLNQFTPASQAKGGIIVFPNGGHDNTWLQFAWLKVLTQFVNCVSQNRRSKPIFAYAQ